MNNIRWQLFLVLFGAGISCTAGTVPTWSPTAAPSSPRNGHQATVLLDGRVLVTGGYDNAANGVAIAEIFDPTTETWTQTGANLVGRYDHTATLLEDGRVIVIGGVSTNTCTGNSSTEIYDQSIGTWTPGQNVPAPVGTGHNALRLVDGNVIVTGGGDRCGTVLQTVSLFDPVAGTWTRLADMVTRHEFHSAAQLPNGQVLVAGGAGQNAVFQSIADAEVYDFNTGAWSLVPSMATARSTSCNGYTQTFFAILPNGNVLAAAADRTIPPIGCLNAQTRSLTNSAEVFDPTAGNWIATGALATPRGLTTLTALLDGRVLVAGGFDGTQTLASAELFDPSTDTWTLTASMSSARSGHTATRLNDGRVLVISGQTAEIFSPGSTVANQNPIANAGPDQTVVVW